MAMHDHPTVLVTGVGAIIGQGIVRSLRAGLPNARIVGLDRSNRQPGPAWCDQFIQKPECGEDSSAYLRFWESVLHEEGIQLVLPGLEVDVNFLEQHRFLQQSPAGCVLALNHSRLITLAGDKWKMHEMLLAHDFPVIPTLLPCAWSEALTALGPAPLLLKPRCNNGSRGIVRLHDQNDLVYWAQKTTEPWMLQKVVGSEHEEYTVGCFGFGDGTSLEPIIMRRHLSAAGNTIEAEVVSQAHIHASVVALNHLFQPLGPTNYQFRMDGGQALLLEVNPRFSSSNSLRTQFGYNEAQMAVEYFLFGNKPAQPTIQHGKGWRFSEDYVKHDCGSV